MLKNSDNFNTALDLLKAAYAAIEIENHHKRADEHFQYGVKHLKDAIDYFEIAADLDAIP